jgi:hypothetical protein
MYLCELQSSNIIDLHAQRFCFIIFLLLITLTVTVTLYGVVSHKASHTQRHY